MQLITKSLPANHNLFFFGDLHIGTILHHEKGLQKFINVVLGEYEGVSNNYCINMGDNIEAIMLDDPRYSLETVSDPLPLHQLDEATKILKPIAGRIITILNGNHEMKLWRFGGLAERLAYRLGVPYGTYTAKVTITNTKDELLYKVFATHGRKGITSVADDPTRRLANLRLSLKKHLKFKAGDCVIMAKGHTHKLLVCKPEEELYLVDNSKEIKQKYISSSQKAEYIHPDHRWYCSTGSFLKLYGEMGVSGYAEIAEYDPLELGYIVAIVRNGIIQEVREVAIK